MDEDSSGKTHSEDTITKDMKYAHSVTVKKLDKDKDEEVRSILSLSYHFSSLLEVRISIFQFSESRKRSPKAWEDLCSEGTSFSSFGTSFDPFYPSNYPQISIVIIVRSSRKSERRRRSQSLSSFSHSVGCHSSALTSSCHSARVARCILRWIYPQNNKWRWILQEQKFIVCCSGKRQQL